MITFGFVYIVFTLLNTNYFTYPIIMPYILYTTTWSAIDQLVGKYRKPSHIATKSPKFQLPKVQVCIIPGLESSRYSLL